MLSQKDLDKIVNESTEEDNKKIDWTKTWSKKYPVLSTYEEKVNVCEYAIEVRKLLNKLQKDYGYNDLDSMLVLKDIMYQEWKNNK